MLEVYDYETQNLFEKNYITGWTTKNIVDNPELQKNNPPTEEMKKNLFNGDNDPKFILNPDGTISKQLISEEDKANNNAIKIARFYKQYPVKKVVGILIKGILNSTNQEFTQYRALYEIIKGLENEENV